MLLDIFKKKKDEDLENVKMIPVPDIKAYMIKGYEEIKEIKEKARQEEESKNNYKEQAENNEKLYNAALVSANEFENRYNDSQKEVNKYKKLYEEEKEGRKRDNNKNIEIINELKERVYNQNIKLENSIRTTSEEAVQFMIEQIKNAKGNLSKAKIIRILESKE